MKRLIPCFLIAGITFFSACEKGQMADMEKQGSELPEGKYPLTFTAVQAAPEGTPQTRVSESEDGMSSHWDGGEVINVQIADGKAGTYTLDEKGKTTAQTPCYWQNTDKATINAWYSNISEQATETNTDKNVSLSNQNKGLAYVLKATVNDVSYNSQDIELQFRHQLAKVRVMLTGEKANDVEKVEVKAYASCNVAAGNVTPSGNIQYIQIHKHGNSEYYEANLVPMESITANDFIRLDNNTKATISGISKLEAGNVYTIEITVEGKTVTIDEDCTVTGSSKPLVIKGDHTVTFDGATITANGIPAIEIKSNSNPTLIFNGTNKIKREDYNTTIYISSDAKLTIQLNDGANLAVYNRIKCYSNSTLEIKGNTLKNELYIESNTNGGPAIEINNSGVNLSISNVTLTAVSGNSSAPNASQNRDYTPSIGIGQDGDPAKAPNITLSSGNFIFYATRYENPTVEHWVSSVGQNPGSVTPDVDGTLKDKAWNEAVTIGTVTLKKLEKRPTSPDWAK